MKRPRASARRTKKPVPETKLSTGVSACESSLASLSNSVARTAVLSMMYLATSKWRSIELRVTEALNEAKDNVKYLSTLEKFIEPLYDGSPDYIKDTLPALMNSIKMIHTIARYYNTNDRMTGLFVKITQQMINNCKYNILYFRRIRDGTVNTGKKIINDDVLWNHDDYPPEELIPVLKSCLELNQAYQKQYEITKERLMNMPKGKQFEFSPN